MNNALVDLYQRQAAVKPKMDENELIDISSEDSEEEAAYNTYKKSNGAATASTSSQNRGVIMQGFVNNKLPVSVTTLSKKNYTNSKCFAGI